MRRGNANTNLVDNVKEYIDLKFEQIQLTVAEKLSLLVGKLILIILTAILSLGLILLFILLIYNLLMMWIGIPWLVTLIEIAFFALIMGLLWVFKDKLVITPAANMIINTLYDSLDNDNEEDDEEED